MHNSPVRVAIAGVSGRMGHQLIQATLQTNEVTLGAALECKDSVLLGVDIGEIIGTKKIGITVQSSLMTIKDDFDVFIDFTYPKNTLENLRFCCQQNKAMVIGTTGFNDIDKEAIKAASKNIAIVFSANFSVGINVMLKILEKTAKVIGNSTDIEIIEAHHCYKVDAPSGTAIAMGEVIAKTINKNLKTCAVYMREGHIGKRVPGTIGFSTIRAGGIIGEHTAMFADKHERLEITHRSSSRMSFANGAIKSALWIKSKKNGLFNMQDVLNIHDI